MSSGKAIDGLLLACDHSAKAAHEAEHADTHGGSRDSQTVANLAVGVAGEAEVDELAIGVGKGGEEGGEGRADEFIGKYAAYAAQRDSAAGAAIEKDTADAASGKGGQES